jgi:hypothetical protein
MISIDSNILTYLVEASDPDFKPEAEPNKEKVAALKILLYKGDFVVTPEVAIEYNRIKNNFKKMEHFGFCSALISELTPSNQQLRITAFEKAFAIHKAESDCRIFADTLALGISTLLCNDGIFQKKLAPLSPDLKIHKPSELINFLNIARGSRPIIEPEFSNPLFGKTFWRI